MYKRQDRERLIISLRYGLDGQREETQKEVADRLGISPVSYTHLDVYKRQPLLNASHIARSPEIDARSLSSICE